MTRFQAVYMNYNTIVFAETKESARKQACSALRVPAQFAKNIAVVEMTEDGKVF